MIVNALRWISRNFSLLILSFILALAVWLLAVVATDPDQEQPFPRSIPITFIGQDANLQMNSTVQKSVNLSLRAPRSVWTKMLSENNPIQVIADLTNLPAGEYSIPLQVIISQSPVRVTAMDPKTFQLTLEPLISRNFPIHLRISGEPALGYQAGTAIINISQATLSGPQSIIEQIAEVIAELDITGARESINTSQALQILDAEGKPVTGLSITPKTIHINQSIQQLGGYRDVAVKIIISGSVANGYRVTNLTVSPPVVTVFSSDPAKVNELPGFIETEPLDLTGAVDDLDKHLALTLPEGVSLQGEQSVLVQVSVAAIEGSMTISLPVEVSGLAPSLQADLSPSSVDVILSGPLPVLDSITPSDLRVIVDVTELETGLHQLVPQVDFLPERVKVETILPATIEVQLSTLDLTPSPTPTSMPQPTPTSTP